MIWIPGRRKRREKKGEKSVLILAGSLTVCVYHPGFESDSRSLHAAVIPAAAAAAPPDRAPLCQRRAHRMDEKRTTRTTTASEFPQRLLQSCRDPVRGKDLFSYPIVFPHHGTYVVLFFLKLLLQVCPVCSAAMVLLCALPSQASSSGGAAGEGGTRESCG